MKAPGAFRSISEVAATLGVPQHTLRAWETRFPFVKPVKRADGRRYYRPSDLALLERLQRLLAEEKLTSGQIVLRHRAGGLSPTPSPAGGASRPLREHFADLNAVRVRLAALLAQPG